MAKEKDIYNFMVELGLEPIKNRAIVVKYAPKNLSAQVADFFTGEYFILQLCREEIAFIPVSSWSLNLKKKDVQTNGLLTIKNEHIRTLLMEDSGFNTIVSIDTDEQMIRLNIQQKELSGFRSSGAIGYETNFWGTTYKNWHKENYEETLADIQTLAAVTD
ncbi:hypothetical protein [Enterococcus larvae]|uniref:hypothetical protein n=1 Tax=Enterococcus larvae TaxID=2794352 RepID=UPI003F3EB75F